MKSSRFLFTAGLLLWVISPSSTAAFAGEDDWPQWQGPDRTGLSKEVGLLKKWPETGPPLVWSIRSLGDGYGSLAIKGDRIYVQGTQGNDSVVFCLNREDGKTLWKAPLSRRLTQYRGNGPRGTPTVDGQRLYVLTESGNLACLQASGGAILWSRNILKDFAAGNPSWLISESPLIDGNHVIVTPGGRDASIVALDKLTGKTIWTSRGLSDPAGYASCLAADVRGVRTIIGFTARAGVGVRARDGKLMWRYSPVANRTANIATPIFHGNKVFYTSAYGTGSALLELKVEGDEVKAEEVYFSKNMQNHHGGVVLVDGYLYGFSGSILTCMEFETGKRIWRNRSVGKGTLTYADGHLYLLSEKNVVGLAEATPDGYLERGRFRIEDQGWPSWAHPVVSGGRFYIRNQGMLACYNIKAK